MSTPLCNMHNPMTVQGAVTPGVVPDHPMS